MTVNPSPTMDATRRLVAGKAAIAAALKVAELDGKDVSVFSVISKARPVREFLLEED